MVKRVDRRYWVNWLHWHFYHRFKRRAALQRRTAWEFINRIRRMPPGSLAIDGGANVGRVTQALVRRGFEVHAFEPDPAAREQLVAKFGANPLVHIHTAALGARSGRMRMYRLADFQNRPLRATEGTTLFPRSVHDAADHFDVEVVDFVDFVRSLGRRVDLVKLDVEGAEVEIMERVLAEHLHNDVGVFYVETHERHHSGDLADRTLQLRRDVARLGIDNVKLDWL